MPNVPKPPNETSLGEKILGIALLGLLGWGALSLWAGGLNLAVFNVLTVALPVVGVLLLLRAPLHKRQEMTWMWVIGLGVGLFLSYDSGSIFVMYCLAGTAAAVPVVLETAWLWYTTGHSPLAQTPISAESTPALAPASSSDDSFFAFDPARFHAAGSAQPAQRARSRFVELIEQYGVNIDSDVDAYKFAEGLHRTMEAELERDINDPRCPDDLRRFLKKVRDHLRAGRGHTNSKPAEIEGPPQPPRLGGPRR